MQEAVNVKADKLLDVSMVAKRLSVSAQTVRRMIKAGRLKYSNCGIRSYRVPASEVERVLESEYSE